MVTRGRNQNRHNLTNANSAFVRLLLFPSLSHPAFLVYLTSASDSERLRRDVFGDGRTSGDISVFTDADRRNQLRIRADEGAVFNDRGMLLFAVVVARDHSGADVDILSDCGVAQISMMHRFSAGPERGLLHFDKVADFRIVIHGRAHSQMSKRSYGHIFTNGAVDENASFQHYGTGPDCRI